MKCSCVACPCLGKEASCRYFQGFFFCAGIRMSIISFLAPVGTLQRRTYVAYDYYSNPVLVDSRLWKPTTAYKKPSPLLYLAFYKQAIHTTHSVIPQGTAFSIPLVLQRRVRCSNLFYRGTAFIPQARTCA